MRRLLLILCVLFNVGGCYPFGRPLTLDKFQPPPQPPEYINVPAKARYSSTPPVIPPGAQACPHCAGQPGAEHVGH